MVVVQPSSLSLYLAHPSHNHQSKPLTSPEQCSSLHNPAPFLMVSYCFPKQFQSCSTDLDLCYQAVIYITSFITGLSQPCVLCSVPQEHVINLHHTMYFLATLPCPARSNFSYHRFLGQLLCTHPSRLS